MKDIHISLDRGAQGENKARVHQPNDPMTSLVIPDSAAAELSSHTQAQHTHMHTKPSGDTCLCQIKSFLERDGI